LEFASQTPQWEGVFLFERAVFSAICKLYLYFGIFSKAKMGVLGKIAIKNR